ncbi:MAG: methyl-accepting chemotaxis protein [Bacillota bacterium]
MKIKFDFKKYSSKVKKLSLPKNITRKLERIKSIKPKDSLLPSFRLKNISIGIKLNVIVTIIIVLSLSIVIFYSFDIVRKILIEQTKEGTLQVSKQTSSNIRTLLEGVDQAAVSLSRDPQIGEVLPKLDKAEDEAAKNRFAGQIKTAISDFVDQRNSEFNSIIVISNNYSSVISGQQAINANVKIKEVESIKSFVESGENSKWYDPYKQDITITQDVTGSGGVVTTLVKNIFTKTSMRSQGKLFFYLNFDNLSRVFEDVNLTSEGLIYIVGSNNNIVLNPKQKAHNSLLIKDISQENKEQLSYIDDEIYRKIKSEPSGAFTTQLYGKSVLITFSTIEEIKGTKLGWTVVTVTEIGKITESVGKVAAQVIIIGLICLTAGILLTQFVNKDITKNIKRLVDSMEEVSNGNLSIDYKTQDRKDEIGKLGNSFSKMIGNLKRLIMSIKDASDITVDASSNVSSKIQQTYASIEQTNAILETIKGKSIQQGSIVKKGEQQILSTKDEINQAKNTMKHVDNMIAESKYISEDNKKSVDLLHGMSQDVRSAMSEIGSKSKELISTSSEITKFTKQIKEIAEQTKLIALNSAIESARLGAQGRSFHLLSEETRKLAAKTRDLSGSIDSIINSLTDKIDSTNEVILKLNRVIENSENTVENVTGSFDKNIDFLNDVTLQISEIQQVFSHIDDFIQEIVSTVKYISTSSESNIQDISEVSTAMNEQIKCQEALLDQTANLLNLSQDLKEKAQGIS